MKTLRWEKSIVLNVKSIKNFKKPKVSYIWYKKLLQFIICNKCWNEDEKTFREEETNEILSILELINNMQIPNERKKHKSII